MENNACFQWTKLVLDHLWLLFPFFALGYVLCKPGILKYISRVKVGDFEVQLAALKEDINDTKQAVAETHSQIRGLIEKLDVSGSREQLHTSFQSIKAQAGHLSGDDLAEGLAGLQQPGADLAEGLAGLQQPGADLAAVHAAAVIARIRKDPATLGALIDRLDRIASDSDLDDIRLNTVWTLASAVHLTLVAVYKNDAGPKPDRTLLMRGKDVLERLVAHPRVQADRPDDPEKGVRGPAGHALRWIETGLRNAGAARH